MKRFKITLLAICIVLAFLGYHDLKTFFKNPDPLQISIAELEQAGAPREWLKIQGGTLDLEQAINPTGQVETFETGPFFIPLTGETGSKEIQVVVEVWRKDVINTLKKFVLDFNTVEEQQAFLMQNIDDFHLKTEVTGMTASWLSSTANQDKLLKLAKEQNMPVSENVIFISEGKMPDKFRGFFFTIIAILGLLKFIQLVIRKESGLAIDLSDDNK